MRQRLRFVLWIACVLLSLSARAQDSTAVFKIYFYVDHADLDPNYMWNAVTLRDMDALVDSLLHAGTSPKVKLVSGASPEGTEEGNKALAENRAGVMRSYLLSHHASLQGRDITSIALGADWEGLLSAVERSRYYWSPEAVRIIRNTPIWVKRRGEVVDSRKKQLMDLHMGDAWRTMEMDIFPYLRKTEARVTFPKTAPAPVEPKRDTVRITDIQVDTLWREKTVVQQIPAPRHGFVLYSNLAYDAALVPSIGTELYFGKGWALNARWSGSWWSAGSKDRFWRIYGAEMAVRKYFREPSDNAAGLFRSSTGHHIGIYGQALTYDIEFSGTGYMGGVPEKNLFANPTWGAGLEYGYTLPVSRHLNLDFSLGVGYLQGWQRVYVPDNGQYPQTEQRLFRWTGPTRLDISLYWLIGMENEKRK